MCEEHRAIPVEEVKKVPRAPRVPEIRSSTATLAAPQTTVAPAAVETLTDTFGEGTANVLREAGVEPGRNKRKKRDAALTNRDDSHGSAAQAPNENPRKKALLEVLDKLDTMRRNNTVPGKKHMLRRLWETSQLADVLGVLIPMNAENNFGKSEGFRKNIFTRLRSAAAQFLSEEEIVSRLQTYLND